MKTDNKKRKKENVALVGTDFYFHRSCACDTDNNCSAIAFICLDIQNVVDGEVVEERVDSGQQEVANGVADGVLEGHQERRNQVLSGGIDNVAQIAAP